MKATLIVTITLLINASSSFPISYRDISGLLGQANPQLTHATIAPTHSTSAAQDATTASLPQLPIQVAKKHSHLLANEPSKTSIIKPSTSSSSVMPSTTSVAILASTLPGSALTAKPIVAAPPPTPTSHARLLFPTSITPSTASERSATPEGEATEWKVVGITVISIVFVLVVVLAALLFDAAWRFMRDVFGMKRNQGQENLVPDWEKRSRDFQLSGEDDHRYPSLSSLDAISKERVRNEALGRYPQDDPRSIIPSPLPMPLYHCFASPDARNRPRYDALLDHKSSNALGRKHTASASQGNIYYGQAF